MSSAKVSIIMPMYNQEKYIKVCLESVMKQTLKDIEIIVVDDGSTDKSAQIVGDLAKGDSRIKYILKPNSGYGNSMNIGLSKATGDYIGIVETDDFVDKKMFETLYKLSQNGTVDIIKGNFWNYFDTEKGHEEYPNTERDSMKDIDYVFNIKQVPNILWGHPSIWSAIYKRSFLEKNRIKFKEEKGGGWVDNPFFFETLCKAETIVYTNEPFYHYRKTNINSSSNLNVNPNLPFDRMNDNLDVLEQNKFTDEVTKKFAYARALQYANGALFECNYDKNNALIDEKAKLLMRRIDGDIFRNYFNLEDQAKYLRFASPINTIVDKMPKILIYNWLPYDNQWGWGGGVTVYCKNLINSIITNYPGVQVYFLSSGFAYDATTTKTYVRRIGSIFGDRCKQYEIVNSPVPAEQRHVYRNPTVVLENEKLKNTVNNFIKNCGPFKAIHFNNIEGLSFDVLDLKKEYPSTKFIYSLHNYIPMCLTNSYYMRHKHCVCNPNHTSEDCLKCSRVDIFSDIAKKVYARGLFNVKKSDIISQKKWIEDVGLSALDQDVSIDRILDFSTTAKQKINKNCDEILAVSQRVYDIAKKEGFNEKKMRVSYIGTKVADSQIRYSNSQVKDKIKVVFLGSDLNYEEKGYPFLLYCLKGLDEKYASKIDLVLTMKQNEDEKIQEELKHFNSVKIIHGYTHADLPNILNGCHLSIVPVVWEDNLPQIAIESAAYGVPVLASSFGGASELCSSELFKFEGGNKQDFLTKLKYFVDNPKELNTYWKHHKGLVTLKEHLTEMLKYYGLPQKLKDIVLSPQDLTYLLLENQFLRDHVNTVSNSNLSNEDLYKINLYNKHASTFEIIDKEEIDINGAYIKLIKKMNKLFPKGSKRRRILKKLFVRKSKKEN